MSWNNNCREQRAEVHNAQVDPVLEQRLLDAEVLNGLITRTVVPSVGAGATLTEPE